MSLVAGVCPQCTVNLTSIRDGSNLTDSSGAQLDTNPYASLRDAPLTILAATAPGKFRLFLTLQLAGQAAVPFGLDKQHQLVETLTEVIMSPQLAQRLPIVLVACNYFAQACCKWYLRRLVRRSNTKEQLHWSLLAQIPTCLMHVLQLIIFTQIILLCASRQ